MKVPTNIAMSCSLHLFLTFSLVHSQEVGEIDTLTFFADQNIDINGIAVTGDVDSMGVYFDVDSTFGEYNILELQLLLSPNISYLTGEFDIYGNRDLKRPGVIWGSIHFVAQETKDFYPNWLRIDLRDSTDTKSLKDDFWLVGFDLLSTVVSETNSGHTFLHSFTLQKWDSIKYDFAVKAIVQQKLPTSVRAGYSESDSDKLSIQNYPNPFNQETTINLSIHTPQTVSISIFDISGRLVRILANNQVINGNDVVVWDGKNTKNEPVSSGIYFYTVRFGQEIKTKKMLLIR